MGKWIHRIADIRPNEITAGVLAFACNFVLLGSYYILRPVRDAMAMVFGVDQLQNLFTGTLLLTLLCSPLFAWLTDTFKLSRVLPGVFGFLILDLLAFCLWFHTAPDSRWLAAGFYWWFSVVNLFMISVFWSLMVDVFTPTQAARLLPGITAGGSLGAIAGPLVASLFVKRIGVAGLLLVAAAGLAIVVVLVRRLIREKHRLQEAQAETQRSTLDHKLPGTFIDGFRALFTSPYLMNQALFMLLMTWVATIGYFLQTEIISKAFAGLAERTQALADIDIVVNICSALVAMFGLSRFIKRFGVTGSLVLNPILVAISFVLMALSPTLLMLQAMQALRRVTQYAIARPSREMCFTVVEQESRYKAKNIIDVVVYRFGDLSSAWAQAGLRALGFGMGGALGLGVGICGLWGVAAWKLGRQYEAKRAQTAPERDHAATAAT
ncbi:MAG TPA: MFS transporter [Steroidobacteraceae bacterium]|nr:MFS transporter [Steroidobacteraceae bacterium]